MRRWIHSIIWPILIVVGLMFLAWKPNESVHLVNNIGFLLDKTGTLSVDEARLRKFKPFSGSPIYPQAKVVWLRIDLPPEERFDHEDAVLFTGANETLLSIEGFLVDPSQTLHLGRCNVEIDSPECETASLQYAFVIKRPVDSVSRELFLRIHPGAAIITPEFYLMQRSYFNRVTIFLDHLAGSAAGFCFLISIFALIIFTIVRERAFLIYSFLCLSLFFVGSVNRGMWDAYFTPVIPIHGGSLQLPLISSTLIFDLLFLRSFFSMKDTSPRLDAVFLFSMSVAGAFVVVGLYYPALEMIWPIFFAVVPLFAFLTTFSIYKFVAEGRKYAVPIAAAWSVVFVAYLVWSFYRGGLIRGHWFFGYFVTLGRMIEMTVLMVVIFLKLRELQFRLGFATAKAQEAEIVKTLFRTITHDLSNTTQVLMMSGSSLSQNKSPEQFEKIKQRIVRATETQRDIIDHAKKSYLVRGGSVVELSDVDLNETIKAVVESLEPRLNEKRISLKLDLTNEPALVMAERTSLANQVLTNLMTNAIKFSNPGGRISVTTKPLSNSLVECIIEDEGIGIPSAMLDRLFDENEAVTRAGTLGELGTGSGMLIVRDFLSAYGAKMEIASAVNAGTSITIRFQRAGSSEVRPEHPASDLNSQNRTKFVE